MNKPEFQTTKIGDITIMSKPIPLPSLSPDGHAAWAGITEMLNADLQLRNSVMQDLFTKALRENAKPPIKGEITKGKLRYRGITLVIQPDGSRYLAQRGQRISDIILPCCNHLIADPPNTPKGVTDFIKEWKKAEQVLYPVRRSELITNDKFVEWTKDIFKGSKGPKKIFVMSEETKQMFVDKGFPPQYIDVLTYEPITD